jgi:hypothetical protein
VRLRISAGHQSGRTESRTHPQEQLVDDQSVPEHLLADIPAAHRLTTAREDRLGKQGAKAGEVAVVDELGVSRDQVLDSSMAR